MRGGRFRAFRVFTTVVVPGHVRCLAPEREGQGRRQPPIRLVLLMLGAIGGSTSESWSGDHPQDSLEGHMRHVDTKVVIFKCRSLTRRL